MSTITERIQDEAADHGVRPVPPEARRFGELDLAVLWGNLSIGILVAFTGAILPGLSSVSALLAIVLGSALGCVLLGAAGVAGAREGVPSMVLFRPLLGVRGSYLPSILNVVQLVGWTAFELWVMAAIAARVGGELLGVTSYAFWLVLVTAVCALLALGGPVLVVRRWMERFGVWVVAGVGLWITIALFTGGHVHGFWSNVGVPGASFWVAVDLVIVMPVSWLPLVADYSRFARRGVSGFAGTVGGYFAGNVWFYVLGVLLAFAGGLAEPTPAGFATAIASIAGGAAVLLALLVGETDQAFADIYSTAVSAQNLRPRLRQRPLVLAVSAAGFATALVLGQSEGGAVAAFEFFLFLLGSFFVPLYGVFIAQYFGRRNRGFSEADLFGGPGGRYWFTGGFSARGLAPWLVGFLVYHWCGPLAPDWWMGGFQSGVEAIGLPYPLFGGSLGASIPAFVAAFLVALPIGGRREMRTG